MGSGGGVFGFLLFHLFSPSFPVVLSFSSHSPFPVLFYSFLFFLLSMIGKESLEDREESRKPDRKSPGAGALGEQEGYCLSQRSADTKLITHTP